MATIVNTITQSAPSSSPTAGTQLKQFDSARITDVSGIGLNYDSGRFNDLHADSAHIGTLSTNNFNLPSLNIDSANITNLTTASFTPARMTADSATITTVNAQSITATSLSVSTGSIIGFSAFYTNLSADSGNYQQLTVDTLRRNLPAGSTPITPGTYGGVNGQGRINKAAIITIDSSGFINSIAEHNVSGINNVEFDSARFNITLSGADTSSFVKHIHTKTAATPGSYGSATQVPVLAFNEFGHITSASVTNVDAITSIGWDSANSKFSLTETNGTVNNQIINGWGDNQKIYLGTGSDLALYHNGTASYIDNNTGALYIRNNVDDDDGGNIIIEAKSGKASIVAQDDEGVRVYYNDAQKLETTSIGVTVSGTMNADSSTIGAGGITTGGHIIPTGDGTIDLGSSTKKFRDLHLSGSSLKMGGIVLKDSSTGLAVKNLATDAKVSVSLSDIQASSANISGAANVSGAITAGSFSGDGNSITNLSSTEVRSHLSAGTGVGFASGEISIGQAVATNSNVQFNNLVVDGNLTVNGATTTVSSSTMTVTDKNITIAQGAADGAAADGGGITIDGANATLTYANTGDKFVFNKPVDATSFAGNITGNVTGTVSDISNHSTSDLSEGSNLYFTNARARGAVSTFKGLTFDTSNGKFSIDSDNVKSMFSGGSGISYNSATGQFTAGLQSAETTTDSSTVNSVSETVISSTSSTNFRSVKFLIQAGVHKTTGPHGPRFQSSEVNVIHHGGNVFMTEYGRVGTTDSSLATYDVDVNSGNIRLKATPSYAETTFKCYKTSIKI